MSIAIYQIDAFTDAPFRGNPAAVCPLDAWLPDDVLQAIAMENNLSETAFFVPEGEMAGDGYRLRWFTPALEVDLCGHATLATGHLILRRLSPELDAVSFETRSGTLQVRRDGDALAMNFPALAPGAAVNPAPALVSAMGAVPEECRQIREMHGAPYILLVYETEAQVAELTPRFAGLGANVIATAPGDNVDFVSRFFAPMSGIDEDPVTGSAHCTLAPYWAHRLDKDKLTARQISARGGDVGCCLEGDRVIITGRCAFYMEGRIELPA
ncbi:MAG: PhzF family phenazine biosynthesis protein [Alphaproteobacteria bacterium]|jgi:PhzF family phenazine biosynthesis protein|nr:PhzF family phenazine biosynthesis protein [Alphaproteobacteria bacterium]